MRRHLLSVFHISNRAFCFVKKSKFKITKIYAIRLLRYREQKIIVCSECDVRSLVCCYLSSTKFSFHTIHSMIIFIESFQHHFFILLQVSFLLYSWQTVQFIIICLGSVFPGTNILQFIMIYSGKTCHFRSQFDQLKHIFF